jgi:transposase-like protein
MSKQTFKISEEVKKEVLERVKNQEGSVKEIAEEHGISDRTIYKWLGTGLSNQPTAAEYLKLKRQNKELLELVGELTVKLSQAQKKS